MTPQTLFVLTVGVAALAGLAHMLGQTLLFAIVFATAPIWWPEVFGFYPAVIAYAASLLIATATLLAGGIPAALAERSSGQAAPSVWPMTVWLVAVSALTLAGLAIGRA
ncbi:hypothetical protein [Elioraea rosea]|uniref:hypothetical protein n=1 Tax=Elioraea rosea TaxID=2492390 RepID=UPI0011867CAF|nr:hypothetical protein [Elioraea rosea]